MAVYVDSEAIQWRGRKWCHLVADSLTELHTFATKLGLKRHWFHEKSYYPHYDITMPIRSRALGIGAIDANRATVIACCKKIRSEQIQLRSKQLCDNELYSWNI